MTKIELQQRLQAQIDLNIKLREQNSILAARIEALQYVQAKTQVAPPTTGMGATFPDPKMDGKHWPFSY